MLNRVFIYKRVSSFPFERRRKIEAIQHFIGKVAEKIKTQSPDETRSLIYLFYEHFCGRNHRSQETLKQLRGRLSGLLGENCNSVQYPGGTTSTVDASLLSGDKVHRSRWYNDPSSRAPSL